MASSMEWTPRPGGDRAGFAAKITVVRYDPDADAGKRYEVLPNIACDRIQYREGAEPPSARFRYVLDDRARAMGWPSQFEEILRLHGKIEPEPAVDDDGEEIPPPKPERAEKYVVKTDDRLVVWLQEGGDPDAVRHILFDGFAQTPQVDVSPKGQQVTFTAAGVAIRNWDEPITTMRIKDGDAWDSDDPATIHLISAPVVFNERLGEARPTYGGARPQIASGNRTEVNLGDVPKFIDPRSWKRSAWSNRGGEAWTLDRVARYLIHYHNAERDNSKGQWEAGWGSHAPTPYVEPPNEDDYWKLVARYPKGDADFYDPNDGNSYEIEEIVVPEYDATGKVWPDVLNSLLTHFGFAMAFRLEAGERGEPRNFLELYRKDGTKEFGVKSVPFQAARSSLAPAKQWVSSMSIVRDYASAFNAVSVVPKPCFYEISVVLAPAFQNPGQVDGFPGNRGHIHNSDDAVYRKWVCNEVVAAERLPNGAYWDLHTLGLDENRRYKTGYPDSDKVLDVKEIFGAIAFDWVKSRLPGAGTLISRNTQGDRLPAALAVSTDYKGPINDYWDGTGNWFDVRSSWRLLGDRLGVILTCQNPHDWRIGDVGGVGDDRGGKDLSVINIPAALSTNPSFDPIFLRLTTVVSDQGGVSFTERRRPSSSLKHERIRAIDPGDARIELIHASSPYRYLWSGPSGGSSEVRNEDKPEYRDLKVARNDLRSLVRYAKQMQAATENPPISGTITIPWATNAYKVGDQIDAISGRGMSLQTNAGADQGEGKQYPYVIGVDWDFSGGQSTTLHLSDRRAEPLMR